MLPAFVGAFISALFVEYRQYKQSIYIQEQTALNRQRADELYKRYVR